MKLQLSPAQAKIFASKAGPFDTFNDTAARILSAFAEDGHDPITRRDLVAVVEAMGGTADWAEYADVLNPLGRAPGRGYYTQGVRVGKRAPLTPTTAVSADGLTVVRKAGIMWTPPVVDPDAEAESWYSDDPGLRRLAIADSNCFGSYDLKANPCSECPLSRWCAQASVATMADLAARLDKETEDAIVAAAEATLKANEPEPGPVETEAYDGPTMPGDEPFPAPLPEAGWPEGYNEVTLPFQGICSKCDGNIAKGETAVHAPGVGMLHQACATAHLAS